MLAYSIGIGIGNGRGYIDMAIKRRTGYYKLSSPREDINTIRYCLYHDKGKYMLTASAVYQNDGFDIVGYGKSVCDTIEVGRYNQEKFHSIFDGIKYTDEIFSYLERKFDIRIGEVI